MYADRLSEGHEEEARLSRIRNSLLTIIGALGIDYPLVAFPIWREHSSLLLGIMRAPASAPISGNRGG